MINRPRPGRLHTRTGSLERGCRSASFAGEAGPPATKKTLQWVVGKPEPTPPVPPSLRSLRFIGTSRLIRCGRLAGFGKQKNGSQNPLNVPWQARQGPNAVAAVLGVRGQGGKRDATPLWPAGAHPPESTASSPFAPPPSRTLPHALHKAAPVKPAPRRLRHLERESSFLARARLGPPSSLLQRHFQVHRNVGGLAKVLALNMLFDGRQFLGILATAHGANLAEQVPRLRVT